MKILEVIKIIVAFGVLILVIGGLLFMGFLGAVTIGA